ncbi:MAG: hypothetical protein AAF456_11150 [Planctomycetota bacterium]
MRNLQNKATDSTTHANSTGAPALLVKSELKSGSIEEFAQWMDGELEQLEERFSEFKTPDAYRLAMGR